MTKRDYAKYPQPTPDEIAVLLNVAEYAKDHALECKHEFAAYLFDMAVETLQNDLAGPKSLIVKRAQINTALTDIYGHSSDPAVYKAPKK